jgi:hypothetical protein
MEIATINEYFVKNGIIPIETGILRGEEHYELFIFRGQLEEFLEILIRLSIKSIFIDKKKVREDDFAYYLEEEEEILLGNNSKYNIQEDGAINLLEINPELAEYTQFIGKIQEVRAIAIIEGKELVMFLKEEWGEKLMMEINITIQMIEDEIERQSLRKTTPKKHHKK